MCDKFAVVECIIQEKAVLERAVAASQCAAPRRARSSGGLSMAGCWVGTLAILGTLGLVGCLPESRAAGASAMAATKVTLAAGSPRQALAGETAYEDTVLLLREPEDGNVVPGP